MNPLVDKALQADQTAKNLKQEAIQALLKDRQTIGEQLKALGHIEGKKPPAGKKESLSDAKKHCKVCQQFGHDGRFHRRKDASLPLVQKPQEAAPSAAIKTPAGK